MKATEQYFPAVLFILPYKVALPFAFVDAITIHMKATEQYFEVLWLVFQYFAQ